MSENQEKYGFVYLWRDRKYKRYYVGCRWGHVDDGYVCSSAWMNKSYKNRPQDFKRRILVSNIPSRQETYEEELRWLKLIRPEEIKSRYYNLNLGDNSVWHKYDENIKTIGQKISASKKGRKATNRPEDIGERISEGWKRKKEARLAKGLPVRKITDKVIEANTKRKGSKHSDQTREKMRNAWTPEARERMSNLHKGIPLSEERRKKLREVHIGKTVKEHVRKRIAEGNSKTYFIKYNDGRIIETLGLKKFGKENGIPYVTLHKAYCGGHKIPKYNIESISI